MITDYDSLSLPLDNETKLRIIHAITCPMQTLYQRNVQVDIPVSALVNTVCHNLVETVLNPEIPFDETDLELLKASIKTIHNYYREKHNPFKEVINHFRNMFNNPN